MSVPSEVQEGRGRSCRAVECTDLMTSHCNGGGACFCGGMGGRWEDGGVREVGIGGKREGDGSVRSKGRMGTGGREKRK